jgi:outer membrane protein OmpA-like peptidoglycan-associated protein
MSVARQILTEPAVERKAFRPTWRVLQPKGKEPWHTAGNLAVQRSLLEGLKLTLNPSRAAAEQEADRIAEGSESSRPIAEARSTLEESSPAAHLVHRRIDALKGSGAHLPPATKVKMEEKLGTDFSNVRVHSDAKAAALANSLGANALTRGNDLFFNHNRYDPESTDGQRLLAHELTHVAQQSATTSPPIQCDLMMSLPTALGGFEIDMATRGAPLAAGMEGHIRFLPDPSGPYSTQIGLIQVANLTDMAGTTAVPGSPIDWNRIGAGTEAGRMDLMTTGAGTASHGWFVDTQTATHARGSGIGPNYIEQWGITPPGSLRRNEFGWLRSPTDVRETSLYDYPSASFNANFDFETVAKATDTQSVYGSLEWGFQIRAGLVSHEYAQAASAESATFNEALERFRGYYTHEPIVLYFDTDIDTPIAGEDTKILGVLGYLSRYPDVRVQIDGYADERGTVAHNADLSLRRGLKVQSLCIAFGIDPGRIDTPIGWGETTTFSPGSPNRAVGSLRANRRVVISFERTASTPITP